MSTTTATANEFPRQNWVIGRWTDMVFIVAAPLLALAWTMGMIAFLGPARGETAVLGIFGVFNVAHHFPTFIRIYGDRDLLERYRWPLFLGPVFPFGLSMIVCGFLIHSGATINQLLFLFLILSIWDPWHFIMQHYGFMRIYDRHNQAPRNLASRMDMLLCWSWFFYVMMATAQWLPDLLYSLYDKHHVNLIRFLDLGVMNGITSFAFGVAALSTMAYAGYLFWCRIKGYYVSPAKLGLMLITFAVMYFTYVPNPLMRSLIDSWTFPLGFATLGMVHVTQYLAIVWKYNRSLASRNGGTHAREGWLRFRSFFSHGGLAVSSIYVGICLVYGMLLSGLFLSADVLPIWSKSAVTEATDSANFRWVIGTMISLLFTSNFTHYYFDGFIWKVRHRENRENLALSAETTSVPQQSWWDIKRRTNIVPTLVRQSIYFLPSLLFLSVSFLFVQSHPEVKYPLINLLTEFERKAQGLETDDRFELALHRAEEQLDVETRMADLAPKGHHLIYKADLAYLLASAEVLTKSINSTLSDADLEDYKQIVINVRNDFQTAIENGAEINYPQRTYLYESSYENVTDFHLGMLNQFEQEIHAIENGVIPDHLKPETYRVNSGKASEFSSVPVVN